MSKILHKELSYELQGCFFDIRKSYGPGQKESVYGNLLAECLTKKNIQFKKEHAVNIYSKDSGKIVGTYKPDFIVDDKIVLELKSSSFTTKRDEKQLYHYLRNSKYELGYLVNFSTPELFLKRIVYSNGRKPFLKILSCVFVFFFAFFSVSNAASIIIDAPESVRPTQEFVVRLVLDTQGEEVNAVSGTVTVSGGFEIDSVRTGGSVVSFWADQPEVENGVVTFSGLIPGGYEGSSSELFSLVLEAKSGTGSIAVENFVALLNDGLGTAAAATDSLRTLSISQDAPSIATEFRVTSDTTLPEPFEIFVEKSPDLFEGNYFAAFSASDKGSGVAYYEVQENRSGDIDEALWQRAESPYELSDQSRASYIFVKAVDNDGNVRISVYEPTLIGKLQRYVIYGIILIVGLLLIYRISALKRGRIA